MNRWKSHYSEAVLLRVLLQWIVCTICSSGHYGPEKLKIETMYQVPQRPLIAHNGPSAQPLRPLHALNVRSQSEYLGADFCTLVSPVLQQVAAPVRGRDETTVAEVTEMKNSERLNDMPHL